MLALLLYDHFFQTLVQSIMLSSNYSVYCEPLLFMICYSFKLTRCQKQWKMSFHTFMACSQFPIFCYINLLEKKIISIYRERYTYMYQRKKILKKYSLAWVKILHLPEINTSGVAVCVLRKRI